MDWLTFISNMTGAIAWPAVVGAIAYFYRTELTQLFAGIKKLKVGPMEAEMFELRTKELRQLAVALPVHAGEEGANAREQRSETASRATDEVARLARMEDELLSLAEGVTSWGRNHVPILTAWNRVEDSLRSFADEADADSCATVVTLLFELRRRDAISDAEFELLRKLYDLRIEAAATTISFSEETVLNYIVAASSILRKLGLSQQSPGRSARLRSAPLAVKVSDRH